MKIIKLSPVEATHDVLAFLEKKGLVRTFRPTKKALKCRRPKGMVERVYTSSSRYGAHALMCIKLHNLNKIKLNSHPDNEEFIIINNTGAGYKPLYMVIGLHKHAILEKKARDNELTNRDLMVLRMKYNDPRVSVFVMLKGTPHCELSSPGKGQTPVFFVTEPSRLKLTRLKLGNYRLVLSEDGLK